ncbi:UDP-glucose 4-epimerase [Roseivivax sp. THAF40]|uniref:NAD-dependent epimerase/dehydratase family protein n=1 Tax=unclassified Roseivivax TaxID=2639302 RepID=UPI001268D358|nr:MULTISPECIES: NAD(P)-dependent oxidoreductase [unclassified Roseivivax]QFS82546.1 UDP-glucose 4-epimerase [Roseivivax sp. THAF197b]QFT46315.1 UDP-glucose 4-epimerase [Roseivivax sp. THAF40]
MKIALTGGTGLVGRFIAEEIRAAGDDLLALSRPDYSLGDAPDLEGCDALIHCAFSHVPGRYRGGEGDDPEGFRRANLDGSLRLFEAARACGVSRIIFLSSRAVYGDYPPGTPLVEDLTPRSDTLYGQVKWEAEQALAAMHGPEFATASIRATGIYGPGRDHKWCGLFRDFLAARKIEPRRSTELHGDDLAAAVRLLLCNDATGPFNASDILLDRHDLLSRVARLTGAGVKPPPPSDAPVSEMRCDRLRALGWRPRGVAGLDAALPELVGQAQLG